MKSNIYLKIVNNILLNNEFNFKKYIIYILFKFKLIKNK